MHGIELSAHLYYDATLFRSVNRRILKVVMISFNLRPISSFLMMGVFFSLFRAYLNFIHQTSHGDIQHGCLLSMSVKYLLIHGNNLISFLRFRPDFPTIKGS